MPWFKIDDGLPTSRKVLSIPRRDRLAAVGLWSLAGAWCAKELTDGAVPAYMIGELGGTERLAEALVTAALWSRTSTGYRFHAWDEYQPAKSEVVAKREKNAEKLRNWRARNQGGNHDVTGGVTGLQNGSEVVRNPAPDPTPPDPTLLSTSPSDADASDAGKYSDEVKELCELLAAAVRANGHKVNVVGAKWWAACERLMRLDGYSAEQIAIIIRWSTADEFWSANIRSMPTLREKFSQLKARRNQQLEKQKSGPRRLTNAEMALAEYQEIYGGDSDGREGNQAALDQGLSA